MEIAPPPPETGRGRPKKRNGREATDLQSKGYSKSEAAQLVRYGKRLQDGSALLRVTGRVRTYLTEDGTFASTAPGWKIPKLDAVSRGEHLQRLERAYTSFWEILETEARQATGFEELADEAEHRLSLQEDGLYPLPVHKKAFFASSDSEKKGLFRVKDIQIPVREVTIDEYDHYLRRFMRFMYGWRTAPLKPPTDPDAIWIVDKPISYIRRNRSGNLGQMCMFVFMAHPQRDAGLVRSLLFSDS